MQQMVLLLAKELREDMEEKEKKNILFGLVNETKIWLKNAILNGVFNSHMLN